MPPKGQVRLRWLAGLFLTTIFSAWAGPGAGAFYQRAQKNFTSAKQKYLADTNSLAAAQELAVTSFKLAENATNAAQRAEVARDGIQAGKQLVAGEPKSAFGHYYLAMNLGELADAEAPSLATYKLVHDVEREFKAAADCAVRFDFAGPARNLGQLYFQAPVWPLSVGSKHKAREWFECATQLAPDYPENQLNLAEAHLKWRQPEELRKDLKTIEALWPVAKTNFTGEAWEQRWSEWEAKRSVLLSNFHRIYGGE